MTFTPKFLHVSAEVRYWEDATVNVAAVDEYGAQMPLRSGSLWKPVIELETGRVLGWPEGATASVHFKVCDAGEYWLRDKDGKAMKWKDAYVPEKLLCRTETKYGDSIIMDISGTGHIQGWQPPSLNMDQWEVVE